MTAAELLTAAKKFTRKQRGELATLRKKYAESHVKFINAESKQEQMTAKIDEIADYKALSTATGMVMGMDYLVDYLTELTGGEANDGG